MQTLLEFVVQILGALFGALVAAALWVAGAALLCSIGLGCGGWYWHSRRKRRAPASQDDQR